MKFCHKSISNKVFTFLSGCDNAVHPLVLRNYSSMSLDKAALLPKSKAVFIICYHFVAHTYRHSITLLIDSGFSSNTASMT